jgi:hypothetical protein
MKQEILKALLWTFLGAFFVFIIPQIYKAITKSDFDLE